MLASWLPRSLREDEPLVVAGRAGADPIAAAAARRQRAALRGPAQPLAADACREPVGDGAADVVRVGGGSDGEDGRRSGGREPESRDARARDVEGRAESGASAGEDA